MIATNMKLDKSRRKLEAGITKEGDAYDCILGREERVRDSKDYHTINLGSYPVYIPKGAGYEDLVKMVPIGMRKGRLIFDFAINQEEEKELYLFVGDIVKSFQRFIGQLDYRYPKHCDPATIAYGKVRKASHHKKYVWCLVRVRDGDVMVSQNRASQSTYYLGHKGQVLQFDRDGIEVFLKKGEFKSESIGLEMVGDITYVALRQGRNLLPVHFLDELSY